jgi:hypothetical protein
MLTITRADVARILDVSTTTVRRLEGKVLFPEFKRNAYWFDLAEVQDLKRKGWPKDAAQSRWFRENRGATHRPHSVQRAAVARPMHSRPIPNPRANEPERSELRAAFDELLDVVARLPRRQLRALQRTGLIDNLLGLARVVESCVD